ncbi:xylulokinase [Paracoccus ravus]|uniref:xylulokinase n=1 Tax=Paracoccus ravus TaxID=2447760 RepID=UPI00106E9AD2|nr:xylulokinase [Paracoccus ravus]
MSYLGIDLGTSSVKLLLIDDEQRVIGSASVALELSRPASGYSEQNPADWIAATRQGAQALRAAHPQEFAAISGIGLSGHMHGATVLGADDQVLRPCILWNDTRSHAEAAALDADPQFRAISGNIVFPGFTAPKLVWMRRHEAQLFDRVAKVLLPKDYLRLWLTGEHVSEMSDSAGTSWLDTGRRDWSDALLEASGMRRDQMPGLVEGTEVSGHLRRELLEEWGLRGPVPVAGGAGDNAAAACGMGTVAAGRAFVSLGTSGVLFAANDRYSPAPDSAVHAFCHALPDTWHQMGVILSATDALNWHARVSNATPAALVDELGETLRAPGVTFLPYLSGERTPHNDARIRGAFIGLDHATDRAAMTRAVLEGVAFAIRDSMEALRAAGTELAAVTAVGGGARSDYWLTVIATVLGLPVEIPADGDYGAAFGAARLGLVAATGAGPQEVLVPPATARIIAPDTKHREAFEAAYARYRALYPALRQ